MAEWLYRIVLGIISLLLAGGGVGAFFIGKKHVEKRQEETSKAKAKQKLAKDQQKTQQPSKPKPPADTPELTPLQQEQLQKDIVTLETTKQYYEARLQQLVSLQTREQNLKARVEGYEKTLSAPGETKPIVDFANIDKTLVTLKTAVKTLVEDLVAKRQVDQQTIAAISKRFADLKAAKKDFNDDVILWAVDTLEKITQINDRWQEFLDLQTSVETDLQFKVDALPLLNPDTKTVLTSAEQEKLEEDIVTLETTKQYYQTRLQQLGPLQTRAQNLKARIERYSTTALDQSITRSVIDFANINNTLTALKTAVKTLVEDLDDERQTNQDLISAIDKRFKDLKAANKDFDEDMMLSVTDTLEEITKTNTRWQEFLDLQTSVETDLQSQVDLLDSTVKKYDALDVITEFYEANEEGRYKAVDSYLLTGGKLFDLSKTKTETNEELLENEDWDKTLLPVFAGKNPQEINGLLNRYLTNIELLKQRHDQLQVVPLTELISALAGNTDYSFQPSSEIIKTPSNWIIENSELKVKWKYGLSDSSRTSTYSFNISDLIAKQSQKWYENVNWFDSTEVAVYDNERATQEKLKLLDFWIPLKKYVDWVIATIERKKTFDWLLRYVPRIRNKSGISRRYSVGYISEISFQKRTTGFTIHYSFPKLGVGRVDKTINFDALGDVFDPSSQDQINILKEFVSANTKAWDKLDDFIIFVAQS